MLLLPLHVAFKLFLLQKFFSRLFDFVFLQQQCVERRIAKKESFSFYLDFQLSFFSLIKMLNIFQVFPTALQRSQTFHSTLHIFTFEFAEFPFFFLLAWIALINVYNLLPIGLWSFVFEQSSTLELNFNMMTFLLNNRRTNMHRSQLKLHLHTTQYPAQEFFFYIQCILDSDTTSIQFTQQQSVNM